MAEGIVSPMVIMRNGTMIAMEVIKGDVFVISDHHVLFTSLLIGSFLIGCNLIMNRLSHRSVGGIESKDAGLLRQFISLGDLICGVAILSVLVFSYCAEPSMDDTTIDSYHQQVVDNFVGSNNDDAENGHGSDPEMTCYIPSSPNMVNDIIWMPIILLGVAIARHMHILMVYSTQRHASSLVHICRILFPLLVPILIYFIIYSMNLFSPDDFIAYLDNAIPSLVLCAGMRAMPSVYLIGSALPSLLIMAIGMLSLILTYSSNIKAHILEEKAGLQREFSIGDMDDLSPTSSTKKMSKNSISDSRVLERCIPIMIDAKKSEYIDSRPTTEKHANLLGDDTDDNDDAMIDAGGILDSGSAIGDSNNPRLATGTGAVTAGNSPSVQVHGSDGLKRLLTITVNAVILIFPLVMAMTGFLYTESGSNTVHCVILLLRWTILSFFNLLVFIYYITLPSEF